MNCPFKTISHQVIYTTSGDGVCHLAVCWYLLVLWLQHLPLVHFSFSVAQVSDRNIRMPNHHGDTLGGSLTEPCEHPLLPPHPPSTPLSIFPNMQENTQRGRGRLEPRPKTAIPI